MPSRPDPRILIGQDPKEVPMSCQRILNANVQVDSLWVGPEDGAELTPEEREAYDAAFTIIRHLAIQMPRAHESGHPGGPLSAFCTGYWITALRDPAVDQPLRMSAGHLSVLGYALQYLFGRDKGDERLSSVENLIETFRTPDGLPGHIEAGIGDIPFGTGPLGKGVSNALGVAFGLKYRKKPGVVDVIMADGDSQEGQIAEAMRLASHLQMDNLIVHGDMNDIQLSGIPSGTVAADMASIAQAAGWRVIEVQNGNDPKQVRAAIGKANEFTGKGRPVFMCYYTTMGFGIPFMEEGSNTGKKNYHGAPLSDEEAEEAMHSIPDRAEAVQAYERFRQREKERFENSHIETDIPLSFTPKQLHGYERTITAERGAARKDIGAIHIMNMMKADSRIVILHADLAGSGGFDSVARVFPDRCINVGVAEANMVMMAAGMRQVGLLPVTYTFAAFGTNEARASARLIDINCGHTRCGVLNNCTHVGLSVGEDGETHQERHYLNIPFDHTRVWMPCDSNQAAAMTEHALEIIAEGHESVYLFSPRSSHEQILDAKGEPVYGKDHVFDGRATMLRGRGDATDSVTIIATGLTVHEALKAADRLTAHSSRHRARVLNVASVRPIDAAAIIQAALETAHLIVVEDHCSEGGLATQVADVIADFRLPCSLRRIGVNRYFPSGTAKDLYTMAGLNSERIADVVQDEIRIEVCGGEDVFVSCIHTLRHNLKKSRFAETARPFVERLKDKGGYLEALRGAWRERECPNL